MTTRIKRDKAGKPIRNADGDIIRTKPNTITGAWVVEVEDKDSEMQDAIHGE